MDRAIDAEIAASKARLSAGARRIARQVAIIEREQAEGGLTADARHLLDALLKTQALLRAKLERLQRQRASKDSQRAVRRR